MEDRREYAGNRAGRSEYERGQERIPVMEKNLRFYLRKELRKQPDVDCERVIEKIDNLSRENVENPRDALFGALGEDLKDSTAYFVDRVLKYQTRMCRDSPNCKRLGCYFKHETGAGDGMLEIEERGRPPMSERASGGQKIMVDKQRRLIEILEQRRDLPEDVLGLVEQLKRTTSRINFSGAGRAGARESVREDANKFVIKKAVPWITREHLITYPGVMGVYETLVVECAGRKEAEMVMAMLSKIDQTIEVSLI